MEFWKRFIKRQYDYWFNNKFIQPERLGAISYWDTLSLLEPHCKDIYLSDMTYGLTSKKEAIKYSIETALQYKKWIKEKHDCDEFSFALMGYWNKGLEQFCFGVAWSKSHAFNIMIDNNKQIWIVEPQNNAFMKIEDVMKNKMYYPFRLILI